MRVEEKQVDGPDLARAEEQQKTLLAEHEETELPELVTEVPAHDLEQQRSDQLLGAMKTILAKQQLNVTHLRVSKRETLALEALQAAVNGRTTNLDQFVFASDRRSLLEQALAVLQPGLVASIDPQVTAMTDELRHVTKNVVELRESLLNLQDGQDNLMKVKIVVHKKTATPPDKADKPTDTDATPSTERTPTTLTGPERPEERAPPTTLGDPDEIASAAANNAWWRRPGG